MIKPMEITLIERSGKRHELTLSDIEPVSSDWLAALAEKFFGGLATGLCVGSMSAQDKRQ